MAAYSNHEIKTRKRGGAGGHLKLAGELILVHVSSISNGSLHGCVDLLQLVVLVVDLVQHLVHIIHLHLLHLLLRHPAAPRQINSRSSKTHS